jgi:hypothetical protein
VTGEHVYQWFRAYKFYYAGKIRFADDTPILKHPPFEKQQDRSFYLRLAQKLSDPQIHGLCIHELFYTPDAHISALTTPDALHRGLMFTGRGENGQTRIEHDLYELGKRLGTADDIEAWLYGGNLIPGCLQEIIAHELPIDLACLLLLYPPLQWVTWWRTQLDIGFGPHIWIDRLLRLHELLRRHRKLWRTSVPHDMAQEFWQSCGIALTPTEDIS